MKTAKSDFTLILIFGPPASGKMTVGQELSKATGCKLFHNHLSIELVHQFFDFGTPSFRRLDDQIRFNVFQEISKSPLPGLIFTLTVDFADPEDAIYIDKIIDVFADRNPKVCCVELLCDREERLRRNGTENRLANKASKRDVAASNSLLIQEDELYRMNSLEGEYSKLAMLKVDNTKLEAREVALLVSAHFEL